MNRPLVSVIIPTYKRPDTLDRAINSVLSQTYPNIEIIVVDDNNPGSEGRALTESKMSHYRGNSKVLYVKHEKNKNGSAARNTGARVSRGDFVAFLDDDDQFLPKKIESQVSKLLSLSGDWGFCYSKYYTQKNNGKLVPVQEHREGDLYILALKQELCVNAGSNLLIRKSAFNSINGFDETFKRNQDHEFLVRLLKKYKIAYVDTPGLIYSVGTTNVSVNYIETISYYNKVFKNELEQMSKLDQMDYKNNIDYLIILDLISPNKKYFEAIRRLFGKDVNTINIVSRLLKNTMLAFKRKIVSL